MAGFSFKQFHVDHDLCGMKVGTDGVMLGAWVNCLGCQRALDVGTGSGLIALMLAQRSEADCQIDAVDIDSDACHQARLNFAQSRWSQRLHVRQADICQWQTEKRYDLIVSNPPYFPVGPEISCAKRQTARYADQLNGNELLAVGKQLLNANGMLAVVLPYEVGLQLAEHAISDDWHLARYCAVVTKPGQQPHRLLLELSRAPAAAEQSLLEVHAEDGGYSEQFIALTREFYLRM